MKEFDKCYAIEGDEESLNCLKELVRTSSGNCRPKLVLLTQEHCVPCQEEKALRAPDIESGVIQEVSINSTRGLAIIEKNGIDIIPALLLLDCKDNLIYPSD